MQGMILICRLGSYCWECIRCCCSYWLQLEETTCAIRGQINLMEQNGVLSSCTRYQDAGLPRRISTAMRRHSLGLLQSRE